jgi:uncharacterized membrane protein
MSNIIVFGFDDESDAFRMRAALVKMQTEYLIEMEDAVVVTCDAHGKPQLHQAVNLTAAGAIRGAFWGSLIGMLFLNPLGLVAGAGFGALAGKFSDIGVDDRFMKEAGATLKPGTSALFLLVRKSTPDKVLQGLAPFIGRGRVLQTSLSNEKEEELRKFIEGSTPPPPVPA